ncbi:MAG: ATP-dependent DNA helicase RecG [Candidatus Paceibacterota bacterium]
MAHLETPLKEVFRLQAKQKHGLETLEIETVGDLLYHFPHRYTSEGEYRQVENIEAGETVVLRGTLENLQTKKSYRKKIPMATGTFSDSTGSIAVAWFHQPYIAKMITDGEAVEISGTVKEGKHGPEILNPEYRKISVDDVDGPLFTEGDTKPDKDFLVPFYRASRGVSSQWLHHKIKTLLADQELLAQLADPIPSDVRDELKLPDIKRAMVWIHAPQKKSHAEVAEKRFSFEEVFAVQLAKKQLRRQLERQESFVIALDFSDLDDFFSRFDFDPTTAQKRAIKEILSDLRSPHAMSRLLEGDVGSGKTFVAAATAYGVVNTPPKGREHGALQVAYMAPTEILARQQFESFVEMFAHLPIEMGLITGSGCRKFPSKVDDTQATNISRNQLLKWIKEGVISMVVGTHSLIQKEVQFQNLAYVIIDEQHRFGIGQRAELVKKDGPLPHLLSMTATPIPRTLALTAYGDLDLSILDERPLNRQSAETTIVLESNRPNTYKKVREKLAAGRQAYVICSQIDKADVDNPYARDAMSVEEMTERMQKEFPDFTVESLHGRMNNKEKEEIMSSFDAGEIDILVSTSVVEVGVNVPNATTIIIENAENFGLAQLHQLRGRVERSEMAAHCFLFARVMAERTKKRLEALENSNDGFELAQADLEIRGPGALIGARQSGLADIAMGALENIALVERAGSAADNLIDTDPELTNHPATLKRIEPLKDAAHFE